MNTNCRWCLTIGISCPACIEERDRYAGERRLALLYAIGMAITIAGLAIASVVLR